MVSMRFTLTAAWTEENRYAAVGACEMLLSNTPASDLRWARSTGTTACMIEFQAWLEDGFRLNTATLTKKCKLRLRAWRAGRRPTGRGSAA